MNKKRYVFALFAALFLFFITEYCLYYNDQISESVLGRWLLFLFLMSCIALISALCAKKNEKNLSNATVMFFSFFHYAFSTAHFILWEDDALLLIEGSVLSFESVLLMIAGQVTFLLVNHRHNMSITNTKKDAFQIIPILIGEACNISITALWWFNAIVLSFFEQRIEILPIAALIVVLLDAPVVAGYIMLLTKTKINKPVIIYYSCWASTHLLIVFVHNAVLSWNEQPFFYIAIQSLLTVFILSILIVPMIWGIQWIRKRNDVREDASVCCR